MANFFTSAPGRQPSMETESTVFAAQLDASGKALQLREVQGFRTVGAHGVVHFERAQRHYLAVPNYYGGDTLVLRWAPATGRFEELQRLRSDGGGSVEAFARGGEQFLGIAEFNVGVAALYVLRGSYPDERLVPFQRVPAPGCGAVASLAVPAEDGSNRLLLIAASYVTFAIHSMAGGCDDKLYQVR